jgi:uncharacterized repeat protein (TIGR01451 family)
LNVAQAQDSATVKITGPAIQIEKSPDLQTILAGETATFTITVHNTGDVGLVDVNVTDVSSPDCEEGIGLLDVGESQSYSCSLANVTADFINEAIASGKTAEGVEVTDSDTADVSVIQPGSAPEFTSTPVMTATLNRPYTYTVSAQLGQASVNADTAVNSITITADVLPAWLSLDDHGDGIALLAGIPLVADVYPVQLRVEDSFGQSNIQKFDITVVQAPAPAAEYNYYLPKIFKAPQ